MECHCHNRLYQTPIVTALQAGAAVTLRNAYALNCQAGVISFQFCANVWTDMTLSDMLEDCMKLLQQTA